MSTLNDYVLEEHTTVSHQCVWLFSSGAKAYKVNLFTLFLFQTSFQRHSTNQIKDSKKVFGTTLPCLLSDKTLWIFTRLHSSPRSTRTLNASRNFLFWSVLWDVVNVKWSSQLLWLLVKAPPSTGHIHHNYTVAVARTNSSTKGRAACFVLLFFRIVANDRTKVIYHIHHLFFRRRQNCPGGCKSFFP